MKYNSDPTMDDIKAPAGEPEVPVTPAEEAKPEKAPAEAAPEGEEDAE